MLHIPIMGTTIWHGPVKAIHSLRAGSEPAQNRPACTSSKRYAYCPLSPASGSMPCSSCRVSAHSSPTAACVRRRPLMMHLPSARVWGAVSSASTSGSSPGRASCGRQTGCWHRHGWGRCVYAQSTLRDWACAWPAYLCATCANTYARAHVPLPSLCWRLYVSARDHITGCAFSFDARPHLPARYCRVLIVLLHGRLIAPGVH